MIVAEREKYGIGRIRLSHIPNVSGATLEGNVRELVNHNSLIVTDAWMGYGGLQKNGFEHQVIHSYSGIGEDMLPLCHRIASLLKRWMMGTLQGAFVGKHLQDYLDEFTFRFNRRKSSSRGKLFHRLIQQAVQVDPVTYKKITRSQSVVGG